MVSLRITLLKYVEFGIICGTKKGLSKSHFWAQCWWWRWRREWWWLWHVPSSGKLSLVPAKMCPQCSHGPQSSPYHDTYTALSLLLIHLSPSADNKFFVGSNCVLFTTIAWAPSLGFDIHWVLAYPPKNLASWSTFLVSPMDCYWNDIDLRVRLRSPTYKAVWPESSYLTSLCFIPLTYEMGVNNSSYPNQVVVKMSHRINVKRSAHSLIKDVLSANSGKSHILEAGVLHRESCCPHEGTQTTNKEGSWWTSNRLVPDMVRGDSRG